MEKLTMIGLSRFAALLTIFLSVSAPLTAKSTTFKVLVVMSYEQDNPWSEEIREGIESVLSNSSEISYFYLNTKIDVEGGQKRAKQAYDLFRQISPDGVITADDNAQRMFVLPYLRPHSDTPIMFSGVNAEPEHYGFPTASVSGILERGHIRESLALAKQLVPNLQFVTFLARDSPSGRALQRQVERESATYLATTSFHLIQSMEDLATIDEVLRDRSDAIYIDSMQGVKDTMGTPMSNRDVIEVLTNRYNKPIIGANQYHVEHGALCAVVKTGQEQGSTAAQMLLKAMRGTPVKDIPIVTNFKGKRVINVSTMKSLDLRVRPIVLLGAKLITSTP